LIKQHFLNIDFLVTVAAIGAIYINQLSEAAAVIFFFSLAEFFEEFGVIIGFKKLNLDEILDKINHLGVGSLDTYEKEYLDAHKYIL
jgi:hypothetical protein